MEIKFVINLLPILFSVNVQQQYQYFPSISLLLVGLVSGTVEPVWVPVFGVCESFICDSEYLTGG